MSIIKVIQDGETSVVSVPAPAHAVVKAIGPISYPIVKASAATGPQGPQGIQGIQGPQGVLGPKGDKGDTGTPSAVAVVATEAINRYDLVTGSGKRATSNNTAYRNKIVGIAINNIANGFPGYVQTNGEISNSLWSWVMGDRIYLNGYSLSTVAPLTGFSVQVAVAIASDTINIDIQCSILL